MQRSARLVWCLYAVMFLEGLFFTALGPLLPTLKAQLDLSTSQAGLLAAGYVSGAVIGAVPAAVAARRLGIKTCTVTGVALFAGGTLAFGIFGTYSALVASQCAAGIGALGIWIGGASWLLGVNPSGERGRVIGAAFGVAAAGEIFGPVVGGLAATVGRSVVFTCVAGVALVLCLAVSRVAPPPIGAPSLGLRASANSPAVRTALWLSAVPPIAWGVVLVLGSLQMANVGASPSAITATFVMAGAVGVVQAPVVGRWSDRRGRLVPIRLGLVLCVPALVALSLAQQSLAVAALVVVAIAAIRCSNGPAVALLVDACEKAGSEDRIALALSIPANAAGLAVGSAVSGTLAQAAGSAWTYRAFGAGLVAVLLALRKQTELVAGEEIGHAGS